MKVTLLNETTNIAITFLDGAEITALFGYEYTLHDKDKYKELTNQLLLFHGENYYGFYGNRGIINYETEALATNGHVWQGRRLEANTISWTFVPQLLEYNSTYGISPHEILNAFIEAEHEIKVIVTTGTNKNFVGYYYFTDGTNSEGGLIEMTTSRNDVNIFWKANDLVKKEYLQEQGEVPKIPVNLPYAPLGARGIENMPIKVQYLSTTIVKPVIKIGTDLAPYNEWISLTYKNTTTEQEFTYSNTNNDDLIIVDCEKQTVTNSDGENRIENFTGDWITFLGALNNIEFEIKFPDNNIEYVPEDLYIETSYAVYQSSITN